MFRMRVFLLLLFLKVATGIMACTTEGDCTKGYSCIDNACKMCLKCSMLFRKGNGCIVDFNACEDCLEGFQEISLTYFSKIKKPCQPIKKRAKFNECTNDFDCPPSKYCREESCVKCFDCELVSRFPPQENCAKGLHDCGPGKNGPNKVDCDRAINSELCLVKRHYYITEDIFKRVDLIVLLSVIGIFGIIGIVMWLKKRQCNISRSISSEHFLPSAPPQDVDVQKSFEECTVHTYTVPHAQFEVESKQTAKVLQQPNAPYYFVYGEINNDELSRNDSSSENNSNSSTRSQDAAIRRSHSAALDLAEVILPRRSAGVDVAEYPAEEPSDICVEPNGSSGMDSEPDDVASTNETTDTAAIKVREQEAN